jgi:hypothetical protein
MASSYDNDLRLNELGTGDASGTWGTITNGNLSNIAQALSFDTQDCFTTDANATTTVADGSADPARAIYFKVTSSATLTATRTLTIGPNTISRLQFIENATTGSQTITIKQGSGATVNIENGRTRAVYLDGAGSTAKVVDAFAEFGIGAINGLTFPTSDGTNGQFLSTNGSGTLSFATVDLSTKANIASPTFTGTPAAPTASAGTNTTQLATTAYVTTAVANAEPFPSGTSMLFQQTAAPTGWTKQTTHNDKALRIVTGTVGTGGSVAFSTALGTGATVAGGSVSGNPSTNQSVSAGNLAVSISGNIANTTLTTSQIPSHSHTITLTTPEEGIVNNFNGGVGGPNATNNTGSTGGGGAHNHSHNLSGSMTGSPTLSGNITAGNLAVGASTAAINVNYVDFIIANKD